MRPSSGCWKLWVMYSKQGIEMDLSRRRNRVMARRKSWFPALKDVAPNTEIAGIALRHSNGEMCPEGSCSLWHYAQFYREFVGSDEFHESHEQSMSLQLVFVKIICI